MPAQDPKKPARHTARRAAPKALAARPVAAIAAKPASKPAPAKTAVPTPGAPTTGMAAPEAASPKRMGGAAGATPKRGKPLPRRPETAATAAKPALLKAIVTPVKPAGATTTAAPRPAAVASEAKAPPAAAQEALPQAKAAAAPEPIQAAAAVAAVLPPAEMVPKAVRGVADTGLAQARDAYATLRHSAEHLSSGLNSSGEAAARGLQTLSSTVLEQIQANADATLGFMRALAGVKTLSEAIELQARHARQQFEAVTAQAKTLAGIVNRTASETTEPVRNALDVALRRKA